MELAEPIESLNAQLRDLYGIDTVTGLPIWRIVWADDQKEKRKSKYTESGIELLFPQVVEVPKYSHITERFILEKLEILSEASRAELAEGKISYEPKWTFESNAGGYLPPRMDVAQLVINTLNFAQYGNKSGLVKYKDDPDGDKAKSLERITNELFGNETDVTDALQYKEGVVVPSKFFGEK